MDRIPEPILPFCSFCPFCLKKRLTIMPPLRTTRLAPAAPIALALLALLALALASLCLGDMPLTPAQILNALLHRATAGNAADALASTVLWNMRLPRLLVAMLTGAALSASGLVMQAYFRNSLASPGLLGVSAGGTTGAVLVIGARLGSTALGATTLGATVLSLLLLPLASIAGAFAATACVIALARRGASTERLLLAGIALNAVLAAVSSYVLSNATLTYERNAQILFWLLGGLEDRTWEHAAIAAPIVIFAPVEGSLILSYVMILNYPNALS
jgi:iron complex transport system permease protein